MRDVNAGWALRYAHANVASFFFIFVYLHIARGLYYSSYREPRSLVWNIGVIILILMMASMLWPNCFLIDNLNLIFSSFNRGTLEEQFCIDLAEFSPLSYLLISSSSVPLLPFSKARTKATLRIGPHNLDILSIIICGMLGDWWSHKIPSRDGMSVRFQIEQAVSNTAYIHHLALYFYEKGYCASFLPKLIKKHENLLDKRANTIDRFNFRITLFTYSNLVWIHEGFYVNDMSTGKTFKKVPKWISEYITPLGLAHLVMQNYLLTTEGLILRVGLDNTEDLNIIIKALKSKYDLESLICSYEDTKVILIKKDSFSVLHAIIKPYLPHEYFNNLISYTLNSNQRPLTAKYKDSIFPLLVYKDADVQKENIIKENKNKSGVYRWLNKLNGKSYVGSSISLHKRFYKYYSYNHIALAKLNMLINKALLSDGYSNFQLEILEYCDPSLIIEREQFYIDFFNPEYNIKPKAYSSLGFKHSESTKAQMRIKTPEHLAKLRKNIARVNSTPFSSEAPRRARISDGMAKFNVLTKSKKLIFTNIETNDTLHFSSFRDAALKMKMSRNTISKHIKNQEPFGIYKISLA